MKKVLVVVDMQNDFIDGVLGTDEAKAIVPKVVEKIRGWDGPVVYTVDTHSENDPEFELYPKHCIDRSEGWRLNDQIMNALTDHDDFFMLEKDTFGCDRIPFVEVYLSEENTERVEDIEFVGVCTDLCVLSNVIIFQAFYPRANISVDASCCAGTSPLRHRVALNLMENFGIDILNRDDYKEDDHAKFKPINMIDTPEDFCDLARCK